MNVTSNARKLIFSLDGHKLYHYQSIGEKKRSPILIVFALVNTPKILDLHPKCSFIQKLQMLGHDIYLLEWGDVRQSSAGLSLDYYCYEIIDHAIHHLYQITAQKVNLLGVCQGGFFSLCYASLRPHRLASLILMVTPIDFSVPNRLMQLIRYIDLEQVKKAFEIVPGWVVQSLLQQVEPFRGAYKHWRFCAANIPQELQEWLHRCPDQPTLALYQFAQVARSNALLNKSLIIKKQVVDVSAIELPILNIYSKHDHFWPMSMVQALEKHYQGKRYQEVIYNGGHVGIFISQNALEQIPTAISAWSHQLS